MITAALGISDIANGIWCTARNKPILLKIRLPSTKNYFNVPHGITIRRSDVVKPSRIAAGFLILFGDENCFSI